MIIQLIKYSARESLYLQYDDLIIILDYYCLSVKKEILDYKVFSNPKIHSI